ncbi:MAG TPA: condensation domain-containing protein [Thermoanaerobaculia bacterium]
MTMENVEDIYPLSPLQESLLGHALAMRSSAGFEQTSLMLEGDLDMAAFQRAWQAVVDRHSVLRTAFVSRGLEEPLQVVRRRVAMPFEEQDWRQMGEAEQGAGIDRLLREDRERGFDPERAPLMRVIVVRLGERRRFLVWSHHHLILDGWCRVLVWRDLTAAYDVFEAGGELRLPPSRPFRDYIEWLQRQDRPAALAFWRRLLAGFVEPTPFAVDRLPAATDGRPDGEEQPAYGRCDRVLPEPWVAALERQARQLKVTPNAIAQGAWALLLSRYSGLDDVMFGTAVAGRPPDLPEVGSIMGMFINNLPVRVRARAAERAGPWLLALQDLLLDVRRFDFVSPRQVQAVSELAAGAHLFDSLMLFQNFPSELSAGPAAGDVPPADSMHLTVHSVSLETSYPLTVRVIPQRSWTLRIVFDRGRFAQATVERMLEHYVNLLGGLAGSPDGEIAALPLLSAAEHQQLIVEARGAAVSAPLPGGLAARIAGHAATAPHAPALVYGEERISYGELERRIADLAAELQGAGCAGGTLIGVAAPDPLRTAIAVLAATIAGGAVALLGAAAAGASGLTVLAVGPAGLGLRTARRLPARGAVLAPHGTPPIMFPVAALAAAWRDGAGDLASGREERVLVGLSEPASWLSCLLFLGGGACLIWPQPAADLAREAAGHGATTVVTTPARALALLAAPAVAAAGGGGGAGGLRRVMCSGAPLPRGIADRLHEQGVEVWSLYGAGETAGWATVRRVRVGDERVGAGLPRPGVRIHVLGSALAPLPIGVAGEICLGGALPAAGHLGHPAWTAARLVPDPFSRVPGARLLRTGDRGRWLPGGEIEVLGRVDQEGTLHGRPLRLDEVEAALRRRGDVYEAAVVPRNDPDGSPRLVAFLCVERDRPPDPAGLRRFLQRTLPEALVPSAFAFLDALPLTELGMVDRQALPPTATLGQDLHEARVAPRTPLELRLLHIWEELFGVRPLGVTDDFFALGGHSLLALQLRGRIRRELGEDLQLGSLLGAPTVAGLAARLERGGAAASASPLVAIRATGSRPPLFAVHPGGGGALCYVELAEALGGHQPFYGLQAPGWDDWREPASSVEELAEAYVAAVREVQRHGPYHLLGWSFGGYVAYEMARRLVAAGEEVPFVVILDQGIGASAKPPLDDAALLLSIVGRDEAASPAEDELRALGGFDRQVEHLFALERQAGRLPEGYDVEKIKQLARVRKAHVAAGRAFQPPELPGRVILLRAAERLPWSGADPTMGWGRLARGGVEIHDVAGPHHGLVSAPWVRGVADRLGRCLSRADAAAGGERRLAAALPGGGARGGEA